MKARNDEALGEAYEGKSGDECRGTHFGILRVLDVCRGALEERDSA